MSWFNISCEIACPNSGLSAGFSMLSTLGSSLSMAVSKTVTSVRLLGVSSGFFTVGLLCELGDHLLKKEVPLPTATLQNLKAIGFYISKREFMNASQGGYTRRDIEDWLAGKSASQVLTGVRNFSFLASSIPLAVERYFFAPDALEHTEETTWAEAVIGISAFATAFFVKQLYGVYKCHKHRDLPTIIDEGVSEEDLPVGNNGASVSAPSVSSSLSDGPGENNEPSVSRSGSPGEV